MAMDDDNSTGNGEENDDGVEAIEVDEVIGTIEIDAPGKFALALRSGDGFAGLVFTTELAREAAAALIKAADASEGK